MKTKTIVFLAMIGCSFLTSCGSKNTDPTEVAEDQNDEKFDEKKEEKDAEFVVHAVDGGMLEVQLAELTMKNAASEDVKKYAEMIMNDHNTANTELADLAKTKNITLPIALSDENRKKYNDLAEKSGEDYEKAYCKLMVDDHEADIKEFKEEAENGADGELKTWASGKVPTQEHHLSRAKEISEKK